MGNSGQWPVAAPGQTAEHWMLMNASSQTEAEISRQMLSPCGHYKWWHFFYLGSRKGTDLSHRSVLRGSFESFPTRPVTSVATAEVVPNSPARLGCYEIQDQALPFYMLILHPSVACGSNGSPRRDLWKSLDFWGIYLFRKKQAQH